MINTNVYFSTLFYYYYNCVYIHFNKKTLNILVTFLKKEKEYFIQVVLNNNEVKSLMTSAYEIRRVFLLRFLRFIFIVTDKNSWLTLYPDR